MNSKQENDTKIKELRKLLFDLHTKWANDPNRDGHHKSNEGYVGIFYSYPNWFECDDYLTDEPDIRCEIYSYLFGPHRLHEFSSLDEALKEVRKWSYELEAYE